MFAGARYDSFVPGFCHFSRCLRQLWGGRRDRLGRASLGVVTTCDFCGREADDAETLTWTTSVENGRRLTYCDVCSRDHLRSIEGKLDSAWW